jgi:AcrR family transcriptional regulator
MDDVAAEAGTSKTVVYRYFADRAELYLAVCDHVAAALAQRMQAVLGSAELHDHVREVPADHARGGGRALLERAVDAYLAFVEDDPEVYRFVVHRPLLERPVEADPVADLTVLIGQRVGSVLGAWLPPERQDAAPVWGDALVGMVRAAGDRWLASGVATPRAELSRHLTDLAWRGLHAAHHLEER